MAKTVISLVRETPRADWQQGQRRKKFERKTADGWVELTDWEITLYLMQSGGMNGAVNGVIQSCESAS